MENRTSFGLNAAAYRDFRPVYPESLYRWLAGLCPRHEAALDCATGTGQAAVGLARHFEHVVATDTDAAQIAAAPEHARIDYVAMPAEALAPTLGRFDLATVAQGAHWFDLPAFYRRLDALLQPDAIVAIWGYSHCHIDPAIDAAVRECLTDTVEPYWAQGSRIIVDHYRTIPFPYEEIRTPELRIVERWSRSRYLGFAATWSAYTRLLAAGQPDPLPLLVARLDRAGLWAEHELRTVQFDLHMRVGRAAGR